MTANLERRLAKLEDTVQPGTLVFAWAEVGQTMADAIAQRFPEGVPKGATVMVFRWGDNEQAPLQ